MYCAVACLVNGANQKYEFMCTNACEGVYACMYVVSSPYRPPLQFRGKKSQDRLARLLHTGLFHLVRGNQQLLEKVRIGRGMWGAEWEACLTVQWFVG